MQVILADNQAIYRAGIARVLEAEVATEVVAECARLSELMDAVTNLRCSVVIFPSSFAGNSTSCWIELSRREAGP